MATTPSPEPASTEAAISGGLAAHCAENLGAVPAQEWNQLVGIGSAPLRHEFLCAWEKSELAGLRSRPVLGYRNGSAAPVAACPGYFYDLDLSTVRSPQTSGVVEVIRKAFPEFLFAHTYELGNPTPLTNPFLVADDEQRPVAVRALIEAGLEEAERGAAEFTLVQNFTSRSTPAGEELASLGFAWVPMLPTAVVHLPYGSFEEYLGAMRAGYRRRAQQTLKRSVHLTAEHLSDFAGLADELARLWRSIYERASEVKREILTPAFFRAASEVEEATVLLMRRPDGSVASFALLFDDGPWLSFMQCGFEEQSRQEGAYFRLLYEIIRYGIETGCEQVDLGITTLAPKLDVGGVPIPLFAWVKHRNSLLQRLLLSLANGPLGPPDVESRRVFKEPPPAAEELVARRELSI